MDRVLLCPNLNLPNAVACIKATVERLNECNIIPMIGEETAKKLNLSSQVLSGDEKELLKSCDAVIVIGGDGTMFHMAGEVMHYNKPILGINSGRLGFLSQLEVSDLSLLSRLKENDFNIETRMVLCMTAFGNEVQVKRYAINDVVITRTHLGRTIDIDVQCGEDPIGEYRADGIIFSTPTGSTAYSLSAGGPIVDPAVESITMTPICPHLLAGRAIVFAPERKITVRPKMPDSATQLCVIADGTPVGDMNGIHHVLIEKSNFVSRFICFKDRGFYKTLNQKLKLRG